MPADYIGADWESYEPEAVRLAATWARANPRGLFLDIGSSIGVFSLVALSAGTNIDYSIRFGGTNDDQAGGIAVAPDGTAYVTGWTASTNFPVSADAFQPAIAAFRDAFFTVLDPGGATVSSTFFGGVSDDFGFRIAIDSSGNAYIAGSQLGFGFPITPGNLNPGGVFRSSNAAASWNPSNSGLTHNVINSLALDPSNPANRDRASESRE